MKMTTLKHWGGVIVILALSACGRTGIVGGDAGPIGDGDGPQPCVPDCAKICELQKNCSIITADRVADCVNTCSVNPSALTMLCLAQLVCQSSQDCNAAQQCVLNPQLPDLQLKIYPASTSQGQIRYRGTVCNQGTSSSSPASLHFYRNLPTRPSVGQKGDQIVQVPTLTAGACRDFYASDNGLPAGQYTVWGQVDAEGAVVELDENNNIDGPKVVSVSGPSKLPDLVVSGLTWSGGSNPYGYYAAKVCNYGAAAATGSTLGVFYNRSSAPNAGSSPSKTLKVGYLSPGACSTYSVSASLNYGTFTSWAYVDTGNGVQESNESNNHYGPLKITIGGPTSPDLQITSLYSNVSGNTVSYTATVCNKGQGYAQSSYLDLFYNRNSQPTPYTNPNKSLYIKPLSGGACTSVKTASYLATGTYLSWGYVDRKNVVKESNESNNVKGPVKFSVGSGTLPDLVVTKLTTFTSSSGYTYYYATVCNYGKASSGYSQLDLYWNRNSSPPSYLPGNQSTSVYALSPGACTTRTIYSKLSPGTYSSWVRVDRNNAVQEQNESNNVYGPLKVNVGGTGSADLVISNMYTNPSPTGYTYYYVQVCNKGTVASGTTQLELYLNRTSTPSISTAGDKVTSVYSLSPGACATRYFYHQFQPGTYLSWVRVDRKNVVPESNESNNVHGPLKVSVGGTGTPDLVISNLNATPYPNGYTYYYITICNKGTGASINTLLDLYYNRSSAPPTSLPGNKATTVFTLQPGACTTRSIYAVINPGTYKSWARVDRNNVVKESNENNNVFGPKTVVVPGTGQPDLVVTNLTANTSSSTGYVYYYATVCNYGKAVSGTAQLDLYTNRSSAPPISLPGNKVTSVYNLQPGACITRYFYATLGVGTYQSWVRVDRLNAVKESNENNNVFGPKTVVVSGANQPDLTISSFNALPSPTGTTYYQLQVCNLGKANSTPTYIDIYSNRATAPPAGLAGNASTYLSSLGAGACTYRTVSVLLKPGTYTSWARVDRSNYVKESNENNNVKGPLKFTVQGGALPDLQFNSFNASAYSFSGSVCNKGSGSAGPSTLYIYYNRNVAPKPGDKADKSIGISSLAPGACKSFYNNNSGALAPGTYKSWAYIDAANVVKESVENNNVAGPRYFGVNAVGYCGDICSTLLNVCKLISQSQLQWCISTCAAQPGSKVMCAWNAANAKQCSQIMTCYTGP
jgi:subtilase family serine protease